MPLRNSCFGGKHLVLAILGCAWQTCLAWAGPSTVVVISSRDALPYQQIQAGFEQRMSELGEEVTYWRLPLDVDSKKAAGLLRWLEQEKPDLAFTLGTPAAKVAARALKDRPIVASMVLDDEVFGAYSNATGVLLSFPVESQLEVLRKICPDFRRIGLIYHSADNPLFTELTKLASSYGVQLTDGRIEAPKDLPVVLRRLAKGVDAYWVLPDSVVSTPQAAKAILLSSFRNRIPVIGPSAPWVKAGALYALDWDYIELGSQSAEIAQQLLKGVAVGSISPAYPRSVRYALNLKTAKHMKMSIPATLVEEAKEVFR